jgi:hypothetical protein
MRRPAWLQVWAWQAEPAHRSLDPVAPSRSRPCKPKQASFVCWRPFMVTGTRPPTWRPVLRVVRGGDRNRTHEPLACHADLWLSSTFFWFACYLVRSILLTRRTLALQGVCRLTGAARPARELAGPPIGRSGKRGSGYVAGYVDTSCSTARGLLGTWPVYSESPKGSLNAGRRATCVPAATTLRDPRRDVWAPTCRPNPEPHDFRRPPTRSQSASSGRRRSPRC